MSAWRMPEPVWVHPSRGMEAIARQRRDALFSGAIPPGFLYEGARQSQLWLEVARRHAPTGLDAFYRDAFETVSSGSFPHLISLGAGGARKEAWLQERLQADRFTPVDVSQSLALLSAHHLAPALANAPRPLVADLVQFPELPAWLSTFDHDQPRLFTAFGITPNLAPEELDPVLFGFLRPQDRLLISANLMPDGHPEPILPQYENRETTAWLSECLAQWGLSSSLSALHFDAHQRAEGEAEIRAESFWSRDVSLLWEDAPFHAQSGQSLRVFTSRRYTPKGFAQRLRGSGFTIVTSRVSPCGQEGVWLASIQ